MEKFLTVRQLQEQLQVDRITIYRMLSSGRLTGVKVGGGLPAWTAAGFPVVK